MVNLISVFYSTGINHYNVDPKNPLKTVHAEVDAINNLRRDSTNKRKKVNLFVFRTNPKGYHYERWTHDHGCRRWFNVKRHTVTDKIVQTYKMGESKPEDNSA